MINGKEKKEFEFPDSLNDLGALRFRLEALARAGTEALNKNSELREKNWILSVELWRLQSKVRDLEYQIRKGKK